MVSKSKIEKIEYKYLKLLNNSLGNSIQLKKELESQNKFLKQFMSPTDRGSLKFEKKKLSCSRCRKSNL